MQVNSQLYFIVYLYIVLQKTIKIKYILIIYVNMYKNYLNIYICYVVDKQTVKNRLGWLNYPYKAYTFIYMFIYTYT